MARPLLWGRSEPKSKGKYGNGTRAYRVVRKSNRYVIEPTKQNLGNTMAEIGVGSQRQEPKNPRAFQM